MSNIDCLLQNVNIYQQSIITIYWATMIDFVTKIACLAECYAKDLTTEFQKYHLEPNINNTPN